MRPTFAVDWDGTCVKAAWPEQTREWMPGAVAALHELSRHGRVIIHTSRIAPVHYVTELPRHSWEVQAEINYIRDMLDEAGLQRVDIHTNPWKPSASFYIDDKAVYYAGGKRSWENVTHKVLTMLDKYEEPDADV